MCKKQMSSSFQILLFFITQRQLVQLANNKNAVRPSIVVDDS